MNSNRWIAIGAVSGALTVALGAFGAHALKTRVGANELAIWNTAVQYQGLHALALIGYGLFARQTPKHPLAGWAFVLGTLLFSGSLYALVLGAPRWCGAITPLGGVAFIAGWLTFAWAARSRQSP